MTQMKKIIIFGDSIAAGLFEGEVIHALDQQLLNTLRALGLPDFTITNLGKRGDSTTNALERLTQIDQELTADYVVLNIGINDAINDRKNKKAFQENLLDIIDHFKDSRIILVGPSYVDEKIKTQTDPVILVEYTQLAKKVAEQTASEFIDFYQYERSFTDPTIYLQSDGLHPSQLGYHFLGSLIAQLIQRNEQQK